MTTRTVLAPIVPLLAGLACAQPADYVVVSKKNNRYLELSSGRPYIPNGLNMVAPPRADSEEASWRVFETWLAKLKENHGNYIRVWLSNGFWEVENAKSGVYDEAQARKIDRMLELCRKHSIRVKMTMEHFRSVGGGRQPWADKPLHNTANGGPARDIADFFNGEASRAQFLGKIEWYRKRYGDQPIIYGWELWNEVNAVNRAMQPGGPDVMAWTETMLPALHKEFPRNLAMQSLGSFDTDRVRELYRRHSVLGSNDLAQVHRYLDLGAQLEVCHGPVDVLAAEAVRELIASKPGKPMILAESGAVEPKHTGPFKLYAADKQGIILHDVLFAPFFAGAAGSGQIWHWDSYVAANDLWWHFSRFAEMTKGLDPVAERFEPSMVEHPRLRVYSLRGRKTTLLWLRDKENNWMTELRDGKAPETLKGLTIPLKAKQARIYDPWANTWTEAKPRKGSLELPTFSRSLVVVMK